MSTFAQFVPQITSAQMRNLIVSFAFSSAENQKHICDKECYVITSTLDQKVNNFAAQFLKTENSQKKCRAKSYFDFAWILLQYSFFTKELAVLFTT